MSQQLFQLGVCAAPAWCLHHIYFTLWVSAMNTNLRHRGASSASLVVHTTMHTISAFCLVHSTAKFMIFVCIIQMQFVVVSEAAVLILMTCICACSCTRGTTAVTPVMPAQCTAAGTSQHAKADSRAPCSPLRHPTSPFKATLQPRWLPFKAALQWQSPAGAACQASQGAVCQ